MNLHDAAADAAFDALIDARFPYDERAKASAYIAQGWSTSLNAAFCVLQELCRPPHGVNVSRERLVELIAEWRSGPGHALKAPLITCARALVDGTSLAWRDGLLIMDAIAKYDGQRAALGIAYFASDCGTPEGDKALEEVFQRICREWERKGV